jgi:hypothetical protein
MGLAWELQGTYIGVGVIRRKEACNNELSGNVNILFFDAKFIKNTRFANFLVKKICLFHKKYLILPLILRD